MPSITLDARTSLWKVIGIGNEVPDDQLEEYQNINCAELYHSYLEPGHFGNGLYFSLLPLVEGGNPIGDRLGYLPEGQRGAIIEVELRAPTRCIFYDEAKNDQDVPNMVNEIEAELGLNHAYPRIPPNFPFIEWLSSINHIFEDVDAVDGGVNIYEVIFPHRSLLPQPFDQHFHGIWRRNYRGAANEFERIL